MEAKIFEGIPSIVEVQCSAEKLDYNADVLAMSLFRLRDKKRLAFVSPKNKECTTTADFSSCEYAEGNSRKTVLRTLVLDLAEGESRSYGCNVTSLNSDKQVVSTEWSLAVVRNSE
nr:hypothetical protein BaRGS_015733 [Batillaria attramentaria]